MYFELCEQVEQTNTTQKNKACLILQDEDGIEPDLQPN